MRWRPKNCLCVIDIQGPGFDLGSFAAKCASHSELTDQQAWDAIFASSTSECQRESRIRNYLETTEGLNPSTYSLDTVWSGTGASRDLNIAVRGVTFNAGSRTALQTFCNTTFGTGLITVTA